MQEREGLRQQVRTLEGKCREFQEALQCKICRVVSVSSASAHPHSTPTACLWHCSAPVFVFVFVCMHRAGCFEASAQKAVLVACL